MSDLVTYGLKDSVATISMDDGKVNVKSLQMTSELNGALDQATADKAVVLLTGRPGVFLPVRPYALLTSQTIKQITTKVPISPYPNIVSPILDEAGRVLQ